MTNRPADTTKPGRTTTARAQRRRQVVRRRALQPLRLPPSMTIQELGELMGVDPVEIIKELMRGGFMLTLNQVVEYDLAARVAAAFGFHAQPQEEEGASAVATLKESVEEEEAGLLEPRPPVVTILGHVDHGKTTLLDYIRKTNVAAREVGGITQHIGAYQVSYEGHLITFIDTPGHEAFTAMRARGAQVTDIVVLVVAADDGVMPQTVEAISHAKAAQVPIIVAINKVDKPEADVERVKRQMAEHDLLIEEWGGDVIAVPVSALTGQGVDELLEHIVLVAEISELKANPHRPAKGAIIEARIDKKRGPVATVLVQTGTLRVGDYFVAGDVRGKVRAMLDDQGRRVRKAGPSKPVEVLGLDGLPQAGDILEVVPDDRTARQRVEERSRERGQRRGGGVSLEDIHARMEAGEVKTLNLIIKTDVQGTVDAVLRALERLNTDRTRITVLHAAAGGITESDVLLASASQAIIVGFNTRPDQGAQTLARQEGVEIRHYDIIYNLIDDMERALKGMLEPTYRDVVIGRATVRAVFSIGRRVNAAGFYVNEGRITRNSTIHVIRNGRTIFTGPVASLKHFRDDVREVGTGFEGGLTLDGFNDFQEGDILEAHVTEREE